MNQALPVLEPSLSAPPRRQRLRLLLLVVVPLAVLLGGAAAYLHGGGEVETDNAYVAADKVPVSAEVSGTVRELLVAENQTVVAGQPLFRLDAAAFRIAVLQAEARLAQVRTDLAALKAAYRAKQAEIALARTRRDFALREQQRQANLVARNFISPARFDEVRQTSALAAQQVVALDEDLKRIAESLGGSAEAPPEAHPRYLAAQAELAQARLDLERSEVRASQSGTVSRLPKPGQYLKAGATALALVVDGRLWVEANFTEKDLTHMHPGQAVDIRIDTYPDIRWRGEVESLSPATGAEFAVIPAQNATGNWVKVAQRVPVRIRLAAGADQPPLRAGLSALATVHTGQRRSLLGVSL
ncbi:HlyD family secretion protein [Pseudomonas sp. GCM10022188]|uniref:HlyD family secretion protein n=1 Tax=Pseudomonas TaxID=286 RepID=UPI001E3D213E|nr:HlyD family secretion protein [Pseudomonas oryzagri]MCC6075648.1 HlyD family secretion protein [Pseudomonas oryzagri]